MERKQDTFSNIKEASNKNSCLKEPASQQCIVSEWILPYIKVHTKSSSREIYGWLIGGEIDTRTLLIIAALSCHQYLYQSSIGAMPDPRELQELSNALPVGLGVVGIYHSHPSEIFHSKTDNMTLLKLARFYPKMVSAVANRDNLDDPEKNKTRWFQYNPEKEKIFEISVKTQKISSINLETFPIYGLIELKIPFFAQENLIPILLQDFLGNFSELWESASIKVFNTKVTEISGKDLNNNSLYEKFDDPSNAKILNMIEIYNKNIKYLTKEDFFHYLKEKNVIMIELKDLNEMCLIKDAESSSQIILEGRIPFVVLISNISTFFNSEVSWNEIKKKLLAECRDQIVQKIQRAILVPQSLKKYHLISANPVLLSYPNLNIKLDVILENIGYLEQTLLAFIHNHNLVESIYFKYIREHFKRMVEIEETLLETWKKRIEFLTSFESDEFSQINFSKLREIYHIRKTPFDNI